MTDRQTVTALHRPPVRQSTLVRSDVAHTFAVFVREIGVWWPRQPYSVGGDRVRDVTVEPRVDGRVYETWDDGTVREWGRLLAWEEPHRVVMSWVCTPATTEVELTFTALGPSLTRVAVEHRGWEALSTDQLAQDCAQPGGYAAGGFDRGWATILGALAAAADPRGGEQP
jgi:activator of Hsp90 ATPase-like protein